MKKIGLCMVLFITAFVGKGQEAKESFSKNVVYAGAAGINERGTIAAGYNFGFEGFFYGKSENPADIDMGGMYGPEKFRQYLIIYGLIGIRLHSKPSNAVFYISPKAGLHVTFDNYTGAGLALGTAAGIVISRHLNIGIKELAILRIINGDIAAKYPVQIILGYEF